MNPLKSGARYLVQDFLRTVSMSIYKDQNTVQKIQLLSAYSSVYSHAKKIMGFRIIVSVVVSFCGIIIALLIPSTALMIGAISGLWSIVSEVLLKSLEKQKIIEGATIQEQFDTELFSLPWNSNLGNKVSPEVIISADRNFKGDRIKLKNWYPNTRNVGRPRDVLLCQRSSAVWDWRLRKLYIFLVLGISSSLLILEIIFAIVLNLSFLNFLLSLLLPSSALLLISFNIIKDNYDLLEFRKKLENKATKSLAMRDGKISIKLCREIQDDLFRLRSKGALIPNWFYSIFRKNFEHDMREAVKALIHIH
ncbi:S-4TM family putative pore-forming effector [Patescibacteria group bacterium]|nr:S-4TM family putative pore-forming effector [Patescibacteria group bacterium]